MFISCLFRLNLLISFSIVYWIFEESFSHAFTQPIVFFSSISFFPSPNQHISPQSILFSSANTIFYNYLLFLLPNQYYFSNNTLFFKHWLFIHPRSEKNNFLGYHIFFSDPNFALRFHQIPLYLFS